MILCTIPSRTPTFNIRSVSGLKHSLYSKLVSWRVFLFEIVDQTCQDTNSQYKEGFWPENFLTLKIGVLEGLVVDFADQTLQDTNFQYKEGFGPEAFLILKVGALDGLVFDFVTRPSRAPTFNIRKVSTPKPSLY